VKLISNNLCFWKKTSYPASVRVTNRWKEVEAGHLGTITTRSAEGYFSIIRKWTKSWGNRQAAELTRADSRNLIQRLEKADLSKAYQKKV